MLALGVLGSMAVRASTYYVDSASGKDANTGKATNAAWRTLAKVNATTFAPGDRILFKAGGSWKGTLWPKGSGTTNNAICLGSYGGSARPLINGGGANDAVLLMNQEFWEINDLEVINDAASDGERRGIHLTGSNYVNTVIDHIHIRNCYIHNIRGKLAPRTATRWPSAPAASSSKSSMTHPRRRPRDSMTFSSRAIPSRAFATRGLSPLATAPARAASPARRPGMRAEFPTSLSVATRSVT